MTLRKGKHLQKLVAPRESAPSRFETWSLAHHCTAPELRRGLHRIELEAFGAAYLDQPDAGFWEQFADLCGAALAFRQQIDENQRRARPQPAGRRIDYAAIKARADIVREAERFTKLRKTGRDRFKGLCPVHHENTPSFVVYADQQRYHCYGCGAHGDIIDLWDALGVDWRAAA